jgi:hypothetical protein
MSSADRSVLAPKLASRHPRSSQSLASRFEVGSVDYVAGWGHPQGHDPDSFRVGMAAIHDGAASLIDAIEAAMTDAGKLELAA